MTKQPHPENGYFSKRDADKRRKIALEQRTRMAKEDLERLRRLHHMRCGTCGWLLETIIYRGIPIHKCFNCGSALLEEDALEQFCGKDSQVIQSIIEAFKF